MTGYPRLRRVARLAMPAACLLLVAGCGSENTNSGDSPQTSAPAGPVEATVVTVHRAGGIAGVNDSWTVRANSPGDLSPAAAAAVLRIASSPAFKAIEPIKPTQVCCDFFRYALTVTYSDGSHTRLQTDDSSPQPAALTRLLSFFG